MTIPEADITRCRNVHERLRSLVGALDLDPHRASLLPGWTIGHVLTHIARNADSVVRRLDGAVRHEVVDQYPGGYEGREADIEAGATRSLGALIDDVTESSRAVDDAFAAFPADAWNRIGRSVDGTEHPVSTLPAGRWHEVEVHLVDLGVGFTCADWSDDLLAHWLPQLLARLPERTDPTALASWVLGRGPAPNISPF